MGVVLDVGGKVAVTKSIAVGEGAVVAGNADVGIGGGVSVVGTSTTTMQPAREKASGRSDWRI